MFPFDFVIVSIVALWDFIVFPLIVIRLSCAFFLVLIAFPLSIDISQYDLDKFYFSIIVVSLLMTAFVATEGMFEEDFEDGSLEQEFLKEKDFYKLVISKIFVYVCLIGIPIAFIGALFSFANGVAVDSFGKVFLLLILSNFFPISNVFVIYFRFGN